MSLAPVDSPQTRVAGARHGQADLRGKCRRAARWGCAAVAGLGVFFFIGWTFRLGLFGDEGSYYTLAPSVSLGLVLVASALFALAGARSGRWAHVVALAVGALACLWGAVRLVQFSLLPKEETLEWAFLQLLRTHVAEGPNDGLMSPITALSFVLGGAALVLLALSPSRTNRIAACALATAVFMLNSLLIVDYCQGSGLVYLSENISVSLQTGLSWLVLGAALTLTAGPEWWPLRWFLGPTSTRTILFRAFLPVLLAAVLITGGVRNLRITIIAAHDAPLIPEHLQGLFATLAQAFILVAASWIVLRIARRIGGQIDHAETQRALAMDALRHACAVAEDANQAKTLALDDLQHARDASEQASLAKSQFLASMSHELRTPLNAIIGYSELLMEEAGDAETNTVADLHKIHAAGKHLLALINDILDLSKIEAAKIELSPETFDLHATIDDVVTTIRPLVEKNGNTFQVRCGANLGVMHSDLLRLRQCLFNLLSNAGKFTDNGAVTLDVERDTIGAEDWIRFRVTDSGIGLSPEQIRKLFQAFTQADASTTRKYGGTGLGLAISLKLAQLMGGTISVESVLGQGSSFTLCVPAVARQPEPTPPPLAAPPVTAARVSQPVGGAAGATVLVADDDPAIRDLLERYLTAEGFRVVSVERGEDVVHVAKQEKPQAITLDVMMPNVDGWAVLAALKADPEVSHIPVVMLTIVEDRNLGFALGAAEYLVKPLSRERILTTLKKCVRVSPSRLALIIEDDAAARDILRRMLEADGWEVAETTNGKQALDFVSARQPNLILLDLMMPEMDGFEFLGELRQHPEWRAIPVIVVTSKDLTPENRMFLNGSLLLSNCVKRVLQKGSFSRDELLREVRELVQPSV